MKGLVNKVLGNLINDKIMQKYKHIFPLENITIRKFKSIKRPINHLNQLNDMHDKLELIRIKIVKKEEE